MGLNDNWTVLGAVSIHQHEFISPIRLPCTREGSYPQSLFYLEPHKFLLAPNVCLLVSCQRVPENELCAEEHFPSEEKV